MAIDQDKLAHDIAETLAALICIVVFFVVVGGLDSILTAIGL